MSKINNLEPKLPETSKTFQIDIRGSATNQRFLGEFVCKIPTLKDQSNIAREQARLNGEYPDFLNSGVKQLHQELAYLKYTLIDVPKFWRDSDLGFELRDQNVVNAVYEEVLKFEDEWLKAIWGDESNEQSNSEDQDAKKE
jgi:hypothetical protein